MAHSSRGWSGARTPSAIKRVRQTTRRRAVNQPRRAAAKTLVSKAIVEAGNGNPEEAREALARALSALDKAAKTGAIHRNAADRRKSRLTLKVNAALGGAEVVAAGKVNRTTGKAAAAKQARARIAASKASRAKGAQTAAGKAREALARTTRSGDASGSGADAEQQQAAEPAATKPRSTGARTTRAKRGAAAAKSGAAAAKPRSRTDKKS